MKKRQTRINYDKWGRRFVLPFIIIYVVFSLIPLLSTFYYSFFEYYYRFGGAQKVGPNFIGLGNYITVFTEGKFFKYFGNTMIVWLMGFIPQIVISLLLALWFTSNRLKIKAQGTFKTIIYMPNLVMAAAFSLLIQLLFSTNGPINTLLTNSGLINEGIKFLDRTFTVRSLVAFMNFLMWFGNTTILLMAGIMGIDQSVIESAQVDGASSTQTFFKIVLPLLKPILLFVLVTSLIGGVQMFDIPQIFTEGKGGPNSSVLTIIMYINALMAPSKQYGLAGAVSVVLFIITVLLSVIMYVLTNSDEIKEKREIKKMNKGVKTK
ncbi:carbohydrate ABC transporter permease [Haploplasma axanthum]|nr:sugar ABC transporter permease [Haploplasma axanthum]